MNFPYLRVSLSTSGRFVRFHPSLEFASHVISRKNLNFNSDFFATVYETLLQFTILNQFNFACNIHSCRYV